MFPDLLSGNFIVSVHLSLLKPLAAKPTNGLTVQDIIKVSLALHNVVSQIKCAFIQLDNSFSFSLAWFPSLRQPASPPECKNGLAVVPVSYAWPDHIGGGRVSF